MPGAEAGQPDFAEKFRIAEALADRGHIVVNGPAVLLMFLGAMACLYISLQGSPWGLAFLFGGILAAWPLHSFLLIRWWREACGQDVDLDLLRIAAEDRKLISPTTSWMGRSEATTLLRIAADVRESPRQRIR